jgi:putative heme-binding domain-containing protein
VIEHPEFMPPELKNRPDLWAGKDKGRIWRIVPKDHKTKNPRPALSKASIAELVKTLEHEEPWYRTTAQRLLLEKNDKAMIGLLTKLLETTKSPHAKIFAAWMLERQGKLDSAIIERLLLDKHARIREHGWRLMEPRLVEKKNNFDLFDGALRPIFDETDLRVRSQVALSVGGVKHRWIEPILDEIARAGFKDRWTRLAIQSSLPQHNERVHGLFLARNRDESFAPEMVREMSALVASQKIDNYEFLALVEWMLKSVPNTKWTSFAGMADGLERRGLTLISVSNELNNKLERAKYLDDIRTVLSNAKTEVAETKQSAEHRMICIRVMSHAPWATAKEALLPLAEKEANGELRIAALRALAAQPDKEVPALLMKLWPSASPSVRREILEAMLRQPARVEVLLDEIESKRMKASELDPLRTRQLMNHANAKLRQRAKKLLADNLPADRAKVLTEYQTALTLKGDAKNGREIFKKNCATCHRVAGVGIDVGPDIADTRTKTLAALLNDIIVPNAAIDANYVNYVVSTKDGKILTGLLTAESASSITLVRAEGQKDVVLRKDIDEIASTGISLMPEGLEKSINVQEMADLLGFLKNWRYLDGSVPTGK